MSEPKVYTSLEMEAALCIWEWLNTQPPAAWTEYREQHGTVCLRWECADVFAPWVLKVYDGVKAIDDDAWDFFSYDWEVIPMIMDFIILDGPYHQLPDPDLTAYLIAKKMDLVVPDLPKPIDADAAFLIALCGEVI